VTVDRPDCRRDEDDTQAVGKVTVFRATTVGTGAPVATITGIQEFEYLGYYVGVATYDGQDVVIASSTSLGARYLYFDMLS
jgi:hypothetical protein